ncbi:type VI secretion system baseplate subunit TssF [Sorangium sp. So ce1000]|uniref:type VI secretion system baseplate subunit TssF n=1 Tax=Sorangium sp. So ce1000 TaxID=3133325 RepID=UPI003F6287D3
MSAPGDDLLEAYQRELTYLRTSGELFARRYPKIAGRLDLSPGGSTDPHVERLIESFAFLTARLQRQLDAELPEITTALLGVLHPYLIAPVPSMAIARFDVAPESIFLLDGVTIPRHSHLFAVAASGETASFRSAYPVTLWPVEVVEVAIESTLPYPFLDNQRDVGAVLRIRLAGMGSSFATLALDRLRIHLSGEMWIAYGLYDLLSCHAVRLALVSDRAPKSPRYLPPDALRPVGFGEDEDLIPAPSQTHRGYRLIREYFAFPQKFLFFDIDLPNAAVRTADRYLDLLVLLDAPPARAYPLTPRSVVLGCTPIINLFPAITEPVRVDPRQIEYRLVADQRRERTIEVHSVVSASVSSVSTGETRAVQPIFSFRHATSGDGPGLFWCARRQPTRREDLPGVDTFISLIDEGFHPSRAADLALFAQVLCTNRDLADKLPAGQVLQIELSAPLRGISCLASPTTPLEPPFGGEVLWWLISQLSLNHLSLDDSVDGLNALREILRIYGASAASAEQQIRGLVSMRRREVLRRLGKDAWRGFIRGLELTLVVDETLYVGASAVLFGAVLSRFFGLYTSINSFTQLVLYSEQREEVMKQWPPMAGEHPIL